MSANTLPAQLFAAPVVLPDPGASGTIYVERSPCQVHLVSAAAETRTLARADKAGATVMLQMKTDGGDITLTVTGGYNEDGDTSFTFSDPGQFLKLESIDIGGTITWRKLSDYMAGNVTADELGWLSGVTAGTGAASKALVLDSSGNVTMPDDGAFSFGGVGVLGWVTDDANANKLVLQLPTGGSVDVPVVMIGQGAGVLGDMAIHDGVVNPTVCILGVGAVATGPVVELRKARGTAAAPTVVTSGDDTGSINSYACVAAAEWVQNAQILFECTGTPATTRGPGVITIKTATDAAPSVLTSALVIGANQVVVPQAGFTPKSATSSAITGVTTLSVRDSGCAFTVAKTSAYAITLPTPAQGVRFKFMVLDTGANAVTISNGSAHLFGTVSVNNVSTAMTGTTLTLASGGSIGDWVEFEGIDATHYLVTGACIAAADITIA